MYFNKLLLNIKIGTHLIHSPLPANGSNTKSLLEIFPKFAINKESCGSILVLPINLRFFNDSSCINARPLSATYNNFDQLNKKKKTKITVIKVLYILLCQKMFW